MEDSGISPAEQMYGSPLFFLGQFLTAAETAPTAFVQQLRSSLPCIWTRRTVRNRAQTVAAQKLQGATQRVCAGAGSATGVPWTLPRTGAGGEILCPRGRR